jgi:mannose-6-phosphate isomerase-like protein (cupin superfamily)
MDHMMEIIKTKDCLKFISQDKAIVQEIVSNRNSSAKNQSLAKVTIHPGKSVLEHYHKKAEELYHIIKGKGTLYIEDEKFIIGVGETVVILPGQKHKIRNHTDTNLIMLVMCAPGYENEDQIIV